MSGVPPELTQATDIPADFDQPFGRRHERLGLGDAAGWRKRHQPAEGEARRGGDAARQRERLLRRPDAAAIRPDIAFDQYGQWRDRGEGGGQAVDDDRVVGDDRQP